MLTRLQVHAIRKAVGHSKDPSVPGASFDANLRRTDAAELVPGVANVDLLSDPKFKAGWAAAHAALADRLNFIMTAGRADLVKYAGRPPRPPKGLVRRATSRVQRKEK
jgi:hypothetical protein